MTNIAAFIGEPLNFKNKLYVYPPSVREVTTNPKFGVYQKLLTATQDDVRDELKTEGKTLDTYPTPYEFLLANCYNSAQFRELVVEAFQFFCHTKVEFLYEDKKIIIGDEETLLQTITDISQLKYLLEEDYYDFQNAIRMSMGDKPEKPPEPIDPNEDPRIRRMKEKIRERDRAKAKRAAEGKATGNGISLSTCLAAICCMGIGITPLNIGEMSYAAVSPIMKIMQEKEKYDIDIRSLLAGADSKKVKPKYWIREQEQE